MLSEKGFSLLEVLLSLTILSIAFLAVSGFFQQSQQVSTDNNNKLVAVNLARMTLDRLQQSPTSYGVQPPFKNNYNRTTCGSDTTCQGAFAEKINSKDYEITISAAAADTTLKLLPVTVTVKQEDIVTSVEGFVRYEK
ncbi:prepilin-type N-terminal cleavage/methylation domain-containing protein [Fictibacillus iocasae]|uniref:Prepilin-type N-terminal cleavage/methylation domain-containing protein n=1 Tax=Fictibacillus iocasae TaxID=2715437 RepID=A0ABW2NVP1_9BACL